MITRGLDIPFRAVEMTGIEVVEEDDFLQEFLGHILPVLAGISRTDHLWLVDRIPPRDPAMRCVEERKSRGPIRVAGVPRLDAAIDAALLLSVLATRAEDHVDLLALDAEVRARVEQGSQNQKEER